MTVTEKTRKAVKLRDGDQCIVAGFTVVCRVFGTCNGPMTMQHTVGRGLGGSHLFDTPDLLIVMCLGHNQLLTSDAEFARVGWEKGWVRSRNSNRDPRLVPTHYADGWYRLTGDDKDKLNDHDALEYMVLIGAVIPGMVA